jgi:hypothetical protein
MKGNQCLEGGEELGTGQFRNGLIALRRIISVTIPRIFSCPKKNLSKFSRTGAPRPIRSSVSSDREAILLKAREGAFAEAAAGDRERQPHVCPGVNLRENALLVH